MKKIVVLLLALCILACGCTSGEKEPEVTLGELGMFSYTGVEAYYPEGAKGAMRSGFRNTISSPVTNAQEAFERAKNECVVSYDSVVVSYDDATAMYCVCFYTEGVDGGDQLVYMDSNGITKLVVLGE